MILIQILLALSALYCGGMWLFLAIRAWPRREVFRYDTAARQELQSHTFHLGLCFILAAGFLGLILAIGG